MRLWQTAIPKPMKTSASRITSTAQNIIMENALVLPMFTVNTSYLTAPAVQGFSFDLEGYPWIYDISITQ